MDVRLLVLLRPVSGFSGPWDLPRHSRGDARPPVHRPDPGAPSLAALRERYGRWDVLETDDGGLVALPRPREAGVKWLYVVSAWDPAELGTWLAEADRAMKEST